jgi:hypothetical protein
MFNKYYYFKLECDYVHNIWDPLYSIYYSNFATYKDPYRNSLFLYQCILQSNSILCVRIYALSSTASGHLQSQHEYKQQQYDNTGQNEKETTK